MSLENYWGDLSEIEAVPSPLAILREQALLLAVITYGALEGGLEIRRKDVYEIEADLVAVAPALDRYSADLVRIKHGVGLYPVELTNVPKETTFKCETKEQFVAKLREVLVSPEVRGVLGSLLAQVRAAG